MGGGWVGYVYVFFACGVVLLLLGGSTALLYVFARARRARGYVEPRVRVTSLSASEPAPSGDDAA